MPLDYSRIWPYVIAGLAMLLICRRLRRSFGPQPLHPTRMWLRVGLLLLLGCTLVPGGLKSGQALLVEFAGILSGAALGTWGAQHTRFANVAGRLNYIPHTYTGIAVSLLFIGRLIYRLVLAYAFDRTNQPQGSYASSSSIFGSPTTLGFTFLLVGYYVCYYIRVIVKSRHVSPEDLEITGTSSAAAP